MSSCKRGLRSYLFVKKRVQNVFREQITPEVIDLKELTTSRTLPSSLSELFKVDLRTRMKSEQSMQYSTERDKFHFPFRYIFQTDFVLEGSSDAPCKNWKCIEERREAAVAYKGNYFSRVTMKE